MTQMIFFFEMTQMRFLQRELVRAWFMRSLVKQKNHQQLNKVERKNNNENKSKKKKQIKTAK